MNENIKVGDRIQKPVIKGYSTGIEEHIETWLVEEVIPVGKRGVLWATGRVLETTDGRGEGLNRRGWVYPVDHFSN